MSTVRTYELELMASGLEIPSERSIRWLSLEFARKRPGEKRPEEPRDLAKACLKLRKNYVGGLV